MCTDREPATVAEALAAVRAGLEFLASVDATALTVAEQADCVRGLAACESVQLAATARLLGAFDAAGGYAADGQVTVTSWLRWQTRATGAAAGATARWMRRLRAHPAVAAGLAVGAIAPSVAREILDWTDRLPDVHQAGADQILTDAAASGAGVADLAGLAEEIARRCAGPDGDDGDDAFARRRLRLTSHYQGHARLDADLTPAAAAAVRAVLDRLGGKTGPEDERTQPQRDHDALEEACRRLIDGGWPGRAAKPAQIQLHMTLSQLLGLPEADPAGAARLAATGTPAAPGADCDAVIAPIVTGAIDQDLLHRLADRAYPAQLPVGPHHPATGTTVTSGSATNGSATNGSATNGSATNGSPTNGSARDGSARGGGASDSSATGAAAAMAGRAVRHLLVADAAALLSGPTGLAAWLRTSRLTGPAASASMPLDLGRPTPTVPAWLRTAIAARDGHCAFPGCLVPPEYCHVHHIIPRADGGPTSLQNCILGCSFHHLVAVHRWGWQLTLNPDGTTTAVHPRGWRTLHSNAPPTAA